MTELEKIYRQVDKYSADPSVYRDAVAIFKDHIDSGDTEWHGHNKEFRKRISKALREYSNAVAIPLGAVEKLEETYYYSLLVDAKVDFDAYCQ